MHRPCSPACIRDAPGLEQHPIGQLGGHCWFSLLVKHIMRWNVVLRSLGLLKESAVSFVLDCFSIRKSWQYQKTWLASRLPKSLRLTRHHPKARKKHCRMRVASCRRSTGDNWARWAIWTLTKFRANIYQGYRRPRWCWLYHPRQCQLNCVSDI